MKLSWKATDRAEVSGEDDGGAIFHSDLQVEAVSLQHRGVLWPPGEPRADGMSGNRDVTVAHWKLCHPLTSKLEENG